MKSRINYEGVLVKSGNQQKVKMRSRFKEIPNPS